MRCGDERAQASEIIPSVVVVVVVIISSSKASKLFSFDFLKSKKMNLFTESLCWLR